jgi:hypothetical protein
MPIEVTEEMVQAARRLLPARWSMQDLHNAIKAAIEAAPTPELAFELSQLQWTPEQVAEFERELAEAANGPLIRLPSATHVETAPAAVELGGVSEIADRYGVARSTVNGWMKRAEKIGMPAPLAILAAGPVYNLVVLDPWYQAWKADSDAAA